MKKTFNVTGTCYPDSHYMMDNSDKIRQTWEMIERGEYFTINRPRQYGKTTTLYMLNQQLEQSEDYLSIEMNFQGIDSQFLESDKAFATMFIHELAKELQFTHPKATSFLDDLKTSVFNMNTLSDAITKLVNFLPKKFVLLIDEVDASSNFTAFLQFLGMLRTKYLRRRNPRHATFHSIVLAGVHDIKSLKYKIRIGGKTQLNNPWNIAADFVVPMHFSPNRIIPMLAEYSEAEEVQMDVPLIAEKLYYYTSGYPFLISKLCKIITDFILPKKTEQSWTLDNLEEAVRLILKENNTNFDSLIKSLENNQDLYDLAYRVLIEGETIPFNPDDPLINLGRLHGIFKKNGQVKIHNRIYEQRIYNYMVVKSIINAPRGHNYAGHFMLDDNALDIKAVLLKFQQFMREQYSDKNKDFMEHHGRLVFLSFLAPILNGQGYSFKEVQASLEKRLDVVITYFQHRYIIELKRWYGEKYHQKGLDQLADYLEIHGVDRGFLLIFDDRKSRSWSVKEIRHKGKDIFAVWV